MNDPHTPARDTSTEADHEAESSTEDTKGSNAAVLAAAGKASLASPSQQPESKTHKLEPLSIDALLQQAIDIFTHNAASQVEQALAPFKTQIEALIAAPCTELPSPAQEALTLAVQVSQLQTPSREFLDRARKENNLREQLKTSLEAYDEVLFKLNQLQVLASALQIPQIKTLAGLLSTQAHYKRKKTLDALTLNGQEPSWRARFAFLNNTPDDAEIEQNLSLSYRMLDMLSSKQSLELTNLARAAQGLHTSLSHYDQATKLLKNTKAGPGLPPNGHSFAGTRAIAIIAIAHTRAYLLPRLQSLNTCLGLDLELPTAESLKGDVFTEVNRLPADAASLATSLQYWIDRTPVFMGSHAVIRIQALLSKLGESNTPQSEGRSVTLINSTPPTSKSNEDFLRFYDTLGQPLPLQPYPENMNRVESQLQQESPWMKAITKQMFMTLRGHLAQGYASSGAMLPPILLVGSPGCGKTYYLQRFAELMGLQYTLIPMGGMQDSMTLRGAPRGWGSARPGVFVQTLEQKRVANPLFILDELEKATQSRHNGSPYDVLLQVLEPQNARVFYDECLQVSIDLSHLILLATANSIDEIPEPIRDRFVILNVNDPSQADLDTMARQLWKTEMSRYGYKDPLMPPYPEAILNEQLSRSQSLRRVVSMVKKVVAVTINVQMNGHFLH